jgi:hypothetical protein
MIVESTPPPANVDDGYAAVEIANRNRAENAMPLTFAALARLELAIDDFVASLKASKPSGYSIDAETTTEEQNTEKGVHP